jgi:hypothetical protein
MSEHVQDYTLDVVASNGVPFRVVYGFRPYLDGLRSHTPVVAFYDRRNKGHTGFGQFVSDYYRETLLDRDDRYALCLYGSVEEWCVDPRTMETIHSWLARLPEIEPI